jgi:fatty acid desaturase
MTPSQPLYDLESTSKPNLLSRAGVSYAQFRQTLVANYPRVWREIAAGWGAILAIDLGLFSFRPDSVAIAVLASVIGGILIGYVIAYLHLFFHEAAHFNLAARHEQSDRLANGILGPLLLSCVEFYRHIHFAHHRFLGTSDDTENSYFHPLTVRFLIYSVTGQRVAQVLLSRSRTQKVFIAPELREKQRRYFLYGAMGHASVVLAALAAHAWVLAAGWCLGVICFTPFFGAVRQLLEHRREGAARKNFAQQDQGKFTRTFHPGVLGLTFGAAGFNRHLLHHWDPSLSYTCLEKVEDFLLNTPLKDEYLQARKSYFSVFKELYVESRTHRVIPSVLELRRDPS